MSQPKQTARNHPKVDEAEALRQLEVKALEQAHKDIAGIVPIYHQWVDSLVRARQAALWVDEEHKNDNPPAITFSEACRNHNREPDAVRRKYYEKMSIPLQRMVREGVGYTCPCCGTAITKKESWMTDAS